MPVFPHVPAPVAPLVPTGTFGAVSGGGLQSTPDYSVHLNLLCKQLESIQFALNGGPATDSVIPGSLLVILSEIKNQISTLNTTIGDQGKLITNLNSSLAGIAISIDKASSTYASLSGQQLALQALNLSETITHNEFQTQVVNVSRAEASPAGSPAAEPIKVTPQMTTTRLTDSVSKIVQITGQITSGGFATTAIAEGGAAAIQLAKGYVSDTTIGANMLAKMQSYETASKLWYADFEAQSKARIEAARVRNTAANPAKPGDVTGGAVTK
jgi:hypothetical protein